MLVSRDQTVFDVAWSAILGLRDYVDQHAEIDSRKYLIVAFQWDPVHWKWDFCREVPEINQATQASDSSESINPGSSTGTPVVVVGLDPDCEVTRQNLMSHAENGTFAVNPSFYQEKESFWLFDADRRSPEVSSLLVPLRLYLPLILGGLRARKNKMCFAMGHLAQTLDGKIASHSGSSRWISNEANLIHAHRLRALCDAVAVGWRTAVADNCQLNVRFVEGHNPTRIVIDPKGRIESYVDSLKLFTDDGPTIVLVEKKETRRRLEKVLPMGTDVFETS